MDFFIFLNILKNTYPNPNPNPVLGNMYGQELSYLENKQMDPLLFFNDLYTYCMSVKRFRLPSISAAMQMATTYLLS